MLRRHKEWWIIVVILATLPIQQLKEGQPMGVALLNLAIMSVFVVVACLQDRLIRWFLLFLTAFLVAVVNGLFFSAAGSSLLAVVSQAAVMTALVGGFSELVWQYQRKNHLM